ncbi:MAG: PilZ domain-containing protein [Deltaproteobacteria bacterium]|nr:PilZ domain-containing protein [Deltaproteobacteria bacterium]
MDKIFIDKGGDVEELEGDRRNHIRFPICLEVKYGEGERDECADFILNACKGGVYIMTEAPLNPGATLHLRFYMPPEKKVLSEFEGQVVGVNIDNPKYPKGMHVKFMNCSKEDLKRFEDFLEGKRHLLDTEA